MKARRKSDGKVIEVTERTSWNGEKIYTADGTFYRKHELDFSVDETKEAEGEVISGWVARDNNGKLYIYSDKPERYNKGLRWVVGYAFLPLSSDSFPDLTWESDPLPVEIIIKRKNESR